MKPTVDYSLYLVTSSVIVPTGSTLEQQVEQAILGGVTLVQLREKNVSTKLFIERAEKVLQVCRKHNVPLLINDRVDVALAVGAEGVHIGQSDMDCATARRILGSDAVIGVTANNIQEIDKAEADGADYVGLGSVYDTATKNVKDRIIGIHGLRDLLEHISNMKRRLQTVAIAGLNASNVQRVIYLSEVNGVRVDGIALVSAIMASTEPKKAAEKLIQLIKTTPKFALPVSKLPKSDSTAFVSSIERVFSRAKSKTPLVQQLTNNVSKNFNANVTLAVGGSPLMCEFDDEFPELARANGALLCNYAAVDKLESYIFAAQCNNAENKPVILDPVGAGATEVRKRALTTMLDSAYFDYIKGNEGEILTLAGVEVQMRGVDSTSEFPLTEKVRVTKLLAEKRRCVVIMTGAVDVISDGNRTFVVKRGHPMLANITASGCAMGAVLCVAAALCPEDRLVAALAATLLFSIAGERAASVSDCGPGSFIPHFVDELYSITNDCTARTFKVADNDNGVEEIVA